ncbi:hypothetical protein Ct9H90mP29_11940 [bacterium]|nr:MAG: hypothetical protein Ct9H90mP29_11940 [bacterium]
MEQLLQTWTWMVLEILLWLRLMVFYMQYRMMGIRPGFPIFLPSNVNTPVTLANMDEDINIEIIVGFEEGGIHILKNDGSLMTNYEIEGASVDGGLSVADLDQDGSMEVVFNTDDHYLHVWEPESNSEIDGWPVHIGEIFCN